jgi:hypothetical protein
MRSQLIGIVLVALAWALFAWRWEIAYRVARFVARIARWLHRRRRAKRLFRLLSGEGTYGRPWGGGQP